MPDPLAQLLHVAGADSFPAVGASVGDDGVTYRVWAADHRSLAVRIESAAGGPSRRIELDADGDGGFSGVDALGRAGDLYWFEVDGKRLPDPASRYQPRGVEGPSQVVDPHAYTWLTSGWRRPPYAGRVIYELHVGTFTHEGTFTAAINRLDALVDLGVNTIELMPLADFAGDRNWGYDGVALFAPARCYGTPDDLRALVDAAHVRGLAVIVDVVYNHLGPCGNVLAEYAERYFHTERASIWGRGLNYDEPPVRRFFLQNACQWFDEFHVDGLRLDAVHAIHDDSPRHLIAEIAAAAHARNAWVIAEDERNDVNLITPARQGGWGVDGLWSDDLHHTLRVAVTGQKEAHFKCYAGTIDEWAKTFAQGWFYDGQHFEQWGRPRGAPAHHVPPERFVVCISNHDQVGNRPLGDRLHSSVSPEVYRALSMLLCLSPYTPMLFMGQEWATDSPFPFFTDLPGDVGANMAANRLKEFAHYKANYSKDVLGRMPDPQNPETFSSAKLNWHERDRDHHRQMLKLYRDCLQLRARKTIFQNPPRDRWSVRQLGAHILGIRWEDPKGDWLLLVGIGSKAEAVMPDDPFVRHLHGRRWRIVIASNEPCFGGAEEVLLWSGDERSMVVGLPGAVLLREVSSDETLPAQREEKTDTKVDTAPVTDVPLPCPVCRDVVPVE